jgi:regulator of replication initiation timing
MAVYISKKLSKTEQKYLWISLGVLGVSSVLYQNKNEHFENYNQVIMSEPYNEVTHKTYKLLNGVVTEGNNNDEGTTIYWDSENNQWLDENLEETGLASNYKLNENDELVMIATANNNGSNNNVPNNNVVNNSVANNNVSNNNGPNNNVANNNVPNNNVSNNNVPNNNVPNNNVPNNNVVNNSVANNNVSNNNVPNNSVSNNNVPNNNVVNNSVANNNVANKNGPNNSVVNNKVNNINKNNVINKTNNMSNKLNKISNNISGMKDNLGNMIDEKTVKGLLNKNNKKHLDYHKAMESPHIPNVAQYGTKGISNIFTPQIIFRKKKRGNMSYNDYHDQMEQKTLDNFPPLEFEMDGAPGKIVRHNRDTEIDRDWQNPTHNLWKSNMNNIPMDDVLYNEQNNHIMEEVPYYYNAQTKQITGEIGSGQEVYWDINNFGWIDNKGNILSIPNGLLPETGERPKDPLDNVKENMNNERKFKIESRKDCKAYVSPHRNDDDEKLVKEAIKNNTWKKFNKGYSMVNPNKWDVPRKRPPVCLPSRVQLPSAVFTNGTPTNVLEYDRYGDMANTEEEVSQTNVGSILPKFNYKETRNV